MSETDVLQKETVETDTATVAATGAEASIAATGADVEIATGADVEIATGANAEASDVAEADNAEINTPWYYNTRTWYLIFVTGIALYWIITGIMGM